MSLDSFVFDRFEKRDTMNDEIEECLTIEKHAHEARMIESGYRLKEPELPLYYGDLSPDFPGEARHDVNTYYFPKDANPFYDHAVFKLEDTAFAGSRVLGNSFPKPEFMERIWYQDFISVYDALRLPYDNEKPETHDFSRGFKASTETFSGSSSREAHGFSRGFSHYKGRAINVGTYLSRVVGAKDELYGLPIEKFVFSLVTAPSRWLAYLDIVSPTDTRLVSLPILIDGEKEKEKIMELADYRRRPVCDLGMLRDLVFEQIQENEPDGGKEAEADTDCREFD